MVAIPVGKPARKKSRCPARQLISNAARWWNVYKILSGRPFSYPKRPKYPSSREKLKKLCLKSVLSSNTTALNQAEGA